MTSRTAWAGSAWVASMRCVCPECCGSVESSPVDIDGDQGLKSESSCGGDCERSDAASADDHDGLGGLEPAPADGMECHCLWLGDGGGVIGQPVRDGDECLRRDSGERGQTSVDREPEGVVAFAEVRPTASAPLTVVAPDAGSGHHSLTDRKSLDAVTDCNDLAHELMAQDDGWSREPGAVIPLRGIGTAKRDLPDRDDDLALGRVAGVWDLFDPNVARSVVDGGDHEATWMWTLMLFSISRAAL